MERQTVHYKDLYSDYAGKLTQVLGDEREAQLDTRLLLEAACGTSLQTMLTDPARAVSGPEKELFERYMARRMKREPVAYILGEWEFMGLPFYVTPDVLIPEQDTEILVEEAMKDAPDGSRILDLCTGSGCILLSLLHYSNGSVGKGTDLSQKALQVAARNAERLGLTDRASFAQGDLFGALEPGEKFDLIVSNPPYIASDKIDSLSPEVRDGEPRIALDGGADGLSFYRRIAREAARHLVIGGCLVMEIGYDQAQPVLSLLSENGYIDVRVYRDYGGQTRVVRGIRSIHQD